jgi:chaperone modulatory protein CbpM
MNLTEREVIEHVEQVSVRRLRAWVRRGWVRPERRGRRLVFRQVDVARLRLVCELRDELDIGEEAMPVILSLLDQVYGLRRELRNLARAVEDQPPQVREAVARRFRALGQGE